MTIEELQKAIESYPRRLYEALEAVDTAEKAIEKLNEQIEEEEFNLSPEAAAVETEPETEQSSEDIQETLVKLDRELALLEVRYEQLKGETELAYRRNPPHGDKVTEATVTAVIKSSPLLLEAKERCLEKKFERETANISRRVGYVAGMAERREARDRPPVTSPKLEKLRERLLTAEVTLASAEMRLEEVKASILPYQLLVQLYTAGLAK